MPFHNLPNYCNFRDLRIVFFSSKLFVMRSKSPPHTSHVTRQRRVSEEAPKTAYYSG